MCGIAGAYQIDAPEKIQRLIEQLKHRGPDGTGIHHTPTGSLGHTRLAILDVAGGHQPISYHDHWISFNGEIYNHQDLRRRYLANRSLKTRTDTEVVLQLYTLFGPRSAELLDGMFALAIIGHSELFLARDPIGIKPLYVGNQGDTLYFASEIKALAQVTDDIREFPAGCWYHSRLGLRRYYRVGRDTSSVEPMADERQALPAIHEALRGAVHKRLMSDVPVGVSLSGGLDSSIVSMLACEGLEQLDSFAVGVEDSPDREAAREVAVLFCPLRTGPVHAESADVVARAIGCVYLDVVVPAPWRQRYPPSLPGGL